MWCVAVGIRPFEDFVRVAEHDAQYLLHQESDCARRSFTKSISARDDLRLKEMRGCT